MQVRRTSPHSPWPPSPYPNEMCIPECFPRNAIFFQRTTVVKKVCCISADFPGAKGVGVQPTGQRRNAISRETLSGFHDYFHHPVFSFSDLAFFTVQWYFEQRIRHFPDLTSMVVRNGEHGRDTR